VSRCDYASQGRAFIILISRGTVSRGASGLAGSGDGRKLARRIQVRRSRARERRSKRSVIERRRSAIAKKTENAKSVTRCELIYEGE